MSAVLLWIVGNGGFLGSSLRFALNQHFPEVRFWDPAPIHLSWTDPKQLREELSRAVAMFATVVRQQERPWALLWCAGTGVVTSSAAELEPEWLAWIQLLDLLSLHLGETSGVAPGSIFLASSAGGVYGGSLGQLLTEQAPPQPTSEYGRHKLRMEEALRAWAATLPSVSCLIGRISSLYGQGQNLRKAQGIISHLSRCLIYRCPSNIYVSLDTRRDYLFIRDCSHLIAASLSRLMAEQPRVVLKIFASEELTSLARIIGIFFQMAKHRPLIVLQRLRTTEQPTSIRLRSNVWRDLKGLWNTDLSTGIHLVHEYQLGLFRRGLLPPPSAH
jgi:UDP-glucose 4-epimerase